MRISVVIPTFRRPASLLRCLRGLETQERLPDEVLVAIRQDDLESRAALAGFDAGALPLRLVSVGAVSASAARNQCLEIASGDVLAMVDDDAIPRPDWIAAIHDRFEADPSLGGLGGPDWIEGQAVAPDQRPSVVGLIQWFGRRIGNHHRGCTTPVTVEWLKGANMSFRREALQGNWFGRLLRGPAAQFGEDFGVSLHAKRAGWRLLYDPAVEVDHYPGKLMAGVDHRSLTDPSSLADASHNETVVMLGYLPRLRRIAFLLWSTLVGTKLLPGGAIVVYLLVTRWQVSAINRCRIVWRGRLEGWRTWRASQREVTDDGPGVAAGLVDGHTPTAV